MPERRTPPVVLSVAGTDSGGAAGTAADLATFAAHHVHGACVITAVTAQDTLGVRDVHPVPTASVASQLDAVFEDLPVAAVKTGMLGSAEVVRLVAERVVSTTTRHGASSPSRPLLVVDPVLVATSGAVLGDAEVARAYREHLLPVATVATPNLDEARALAGHDGGPEELAAELSGLGCAVVVTGGGTLGTCTDWVALGGADGEVTQVAHPSVDTTNDHGTGCTFSAALAAQLARGAPLLVAVRRASAYTALQLETSRNWALGRGRGPVAHTVSHPAGHPTGLPGHSTDPHHLTYQGAAR